MKTITNGWTVAAGSSFCQSPRLDWTESLPPKTEGFLFAQAWFTIAVRNAAFELVGEATGLANGSTTWRRRTLAVAITVVALGVLAFLVTPLGRYAGWAWRRLAGGATVEQRLEQYGPVTRDRLKPFFDAAGIEYPPSKLVLIGIKDTKQLELWGRNSDGTFRHVRTYPVLSASGRLGPKLREGDRQVPEGLYQIESLHPNSMFHLALRVNYPNEDDRMRAQADGRSNLGGDIMIHGSNGSVGCMAMGDQAAEDLFVLVADVGLANTDLILTPVDFRASPGAVTADAPAWTEQLYSEIHQRLSQFRQDVVMRRQ